MKVFVLSLNSCGMRNTAIQSYIDFIRANGHDVVAKIENSEMLLIWTCAFRHDVRDNSLAVIDHHVQTYKGEILVAGCLPDIDRERLARHFRGRLVPWRNDHSELESIFGAKGKKLAGVPLVLHKNRLYRDEIAFRKENPTTDAPYVGRYMQLYVSEGCPWECTYCSERLAFPPYRSFPEDQIVETCRRELARDGGSSVVLLGDSVGDYGGDLGSSFPDLVEHLRTAVPHIKIAVQDFNPHHFCKFFSEMTRFIREGLIVHLQMPYQSASERILKAMKRPYGPEELRQAFGALNELGFTEFDSHMIVGFPGETDDDFQMSLDFALRYRPKYMLVNGFMEVPAMPAAGYAGKVDAQTKHRRILQAHDELKSAGLIVNCDDSEFARERFNRMNQGPPSDRTLKGTST